MINGLVGALSLVLCARSAGLPAPRIQEDSAERRRPHALLVGCDEYPYLRELGAAYERDVRLAGPTSDVVLVRQTLEHVFGLEEKRTTVLAGWSDEPSARPTRGNILAALERLVHTVRSGELAIVYLAGHGSQQRVQHEKSAEEPDGLDEVFLAADAHRAQEGWIPNSIRDDEIGTHLRAIRDAGADVWLIVDACHSGTMLRGSSVEGVRFRQIDPLLLGVESVTRGGRARPALQAGWIRASASGRIAALYGSQSYGSAPEILVPREPPQVVHGLFTYLLCQELERSGGRGTYQELNERVIAAYQAYPCGITVPGAEGDLEREILSGEQASAPSLLCTLRSGEPWLNRGRLAGIEPGLVVRVLSLEPAKDAVLAHLEVLEAGLFGARCRTMDGQLTGAASFPAEVERWANEDWRLDVALVRPDGSALEVDDAPEEVRALLTSSHDRFPLVAPDKADWWIVRAEDETWLHPGPREGGFDLFYRQGLRDALVSIQLTRNLRRCAGDVLRAAWTGEIALPIERRSKKGRVERVGPGAVLHPGEEIRFILEKTGQRIFDVNVFYLDANFGRTPLFPTDGQPRLPVQAKEVSIDLSRWFSVVDDGLGLEHLLVFATPREPSSEQINLAWLRDGGVLRGSRTDALQNLLAEALRGENLRGESLAGGEELLDTQCLLISLRTEWRPLVPPIWPGTGVFAREQAREDLELFSGVPDPWHQGKKAALMSSSVAKERADMLWIGDESVRAVLIDFDGDSRGSPEELIRGQRFDPEAAFVFAPEARFGYYASHASGELDLVLIDRDGDGVAEERCTRRGEAWTHRTGVALPWLSQIHLARGQGGTPQERCARLAVLQSDG